MPLFIKAKSKSSRRLAIFTQRADQKFMPLPRLRTKYNRRRWLKGKAHSATHLKLWTCRLLRCRRCRRYRCCPKGIVRSATHFRLSMSHCHLRRRRLRVTCSTLQLWQSLPPLQLMLTTVRCTIHILRLVLTNPCYCHRCSLRMARSTTSLLQSLPRLSVSHWRPPLPPITYEVLSSGGPPAEKRWIPFVPVWAVLPKNRPGSKKRGFRGLSFFGLGRPPRAQSKKPEKRAGNFSGKKPPGGKGPPGHIGPWGAGGFWFVPFFPQIFCLF
eukprot:FR734761.1.p2 GENE.FR734761.1~~FR734761.1.p2  ORF type:complete len:270 (+),score=34.98 FR734761.1:418-1227(+)